MTDDDWNVLMQEKITRAPWWKHKPYFHFGLREDCPYIWFGYWLITWDRSYQGMLRIDISFLPD